MRYAAGLVCVLILCVACLADTVETIDGQMLEGRRITGLPELITLEDAGVLIDIDSDRLLSLDLMGESAKVVTTTSQELRGAINLAISTLTLVTETGETSIPIDQVARVVFDRGADRPRAASATAILADGRIFSGSLSESFPDEITLDTSGIRTATRVRSITSITLGESTTIETASGAITGEIVTSLPAWIELETRFGSYRIPTELASRIELVPTRSFVPGEASRQSAGIGLKIRGSLPFVVGNLSLRNFGVNGALGFGTSAISGVSVDVTAFWYTAALRYIVTIPGIDRYLRPHIGGGIIGVSVVATSGSASASVNMFGIDAGLGIDVPLATLGVPLTIFAGTNWSFLGGASVIAYEIGIRLDFGF